jgi:hypothetical protein
MCILHLNYNQCMFLLIESCEVHHGKMMISENALVALGACNMSILVSFWSMSHSPGVQVYSCLQRRYCKEF